MNAFAPNRKPVIFCDFDGTITLSDNIVAIMKEFKPEGWEALVELVIDGRMSIREGVGGMFDLFPSEMKDEIRDFVLRTAGIRPGFAELLLFCREQGIDFYVTSGGIDFFVHPLLAPFDLKPEQIYCNTSDFSGERIRIVWPNTCDEHCHNDCGMCKPRVIRKFPADQYYRILIGDSITDFEAAKLADLIFARSHLKDRCEQLGVPYHAYETFHDVIRELRQGGITAHHESHHG